jgi:hypothetical protein
MAIGLPWLVELTQAPLVRVDEPDHRLGDVNLVFQPHSRGRKPIGVSFCNQEPRSLWRRLDRLLAQWNATKGTALGLLAILRSETERTTDTAERRLGTLKQAGVQVIRVDRQQLAELAAFQAMLTAALEGDLTRSGKPVEAAEYNAWAREALSEAVKELFHVVFVVEPIASAVPLATSGRRKKAAVAEK